MVCEEVALRARRGAVRREPGARQPAGQHRLHRRGVVALDEHHPVDFAVLAAMQQALAALQVDPKDLAIVSGIIQATGQQIDAAAAAGAI